MTNHSAACIEIHFLICVVFHYLLSLVLHQSKVSKLITTISVQPLYFYKYSFAHLAKSDYCGLKVTVIRFIYTSKHGNVNFSARKRHNPVVLCCLVPLTAVVHRNMHPRVLSNASICLHRVSKYSIETHSIQFQIYKYKHRSTYWAAIIHFYFLRAINNQSHEIK